MSVVHVDLGKVHEFPDLTPIPKRLHVNFDIEVIDDHAVDGDWAVSQSIKDHGVWEPVETALLSSAFAGNRNSLFLDFGSHVGWYSIIARQWGLPVLAYDAALPCIEMLARRGDDQLLPMQAWIDESFTASFPAAPAGKPLLVIVKMDIEGNEQFAVKGLAEAFRDGVITHCLMEVSPVFNASYPHIVNVLIGRGYECWVLPEKRVPPPILGDTREFLVHNCRGLHGMVESQRRIWINDQHQFNAIFCKEDSKWG